MDWLFWGWLKAFIGFSFYQVIASAFIFIFSKVLTSMFQVIGTLSLSNALINLPALFITLFVCIYGLVKIPELTGAILSGRSGTWVKPNGEVIMTHKNKTLPITDAGHKFLELYAEPVVTNTYLKVALLVLSVVTLASLVLLYRAETAALRLKPLVIAVSEAGRGQVSSYADFSKVPVDRVSKYYLARWTELYYGRNHATLHRDFTESLNFFSNDLQGATLLRVTKAKTLETIPARPPAPRMSISKLRQSCLRTCDRLRIAPISNSKRSSVHSGDQDEQRRERWTANVVYGFRDEVPNKMLLTNPLGLVISYVHEDQAFGS